MAAKSQKLNWDAIEAVAKLHDITPEQAYDVLDACYTESFWEHFNPAVLVSARAEAKKIFEAQSRRGNP